MRLRGFSVSVVADELGSLSASRRPVAEDHQCLALIFGTEGVG
ncbi:hypothetical protein BJY26_002796 [Spelaeicoccus albus]|uniref:Uncharacterized protein n=1 Tax=Spelaeicoccus albus TaxID=1280376 RepID=A0A7Z0D422_9MICO|nr:hypothetical protein [Spelaeicoccus albus]